MPEPEEIKERRQRNLTDHDIEALVDALFNRFQIKLKEWIGDGVLGLIRKGIFLVLFALAVLGAAHTAGKL